MKFSYETQGAITYLVCELEANEQVDNLTLGMLTNNHINGLAPVLYTEMDGQKFLKYNISAKVAVNQFFSGNMNKQRAMQAFQSILNALCSADEYMIDPNCFSVNPEHVFLNVSNCESALICIPVVTEKNVNVEAAAMFKQILFTTQFDPNEDASYITQMITYLNNAAGFTVYGFRDLVQRIGNGQAIPGAQVQPQPQAQMQTPVTPTVTPPVSSFDSTISIDDMPGLMGGGQPPVQTPPPVQQGTPPQPQPQIRRPVPVQPVQPQMQIPQQPVQPQTPMGGVPNQQPPKGQQPIPNMQKPPVQQGPGFAIPGQNGVGVKAPQPQVQPAQQVPAGEGEKKISFMGLMMHYSKENAAKYKAQKEAKKSQEAAAKQAKQPKQPKNAVPAQQTQQPTAAQQGRPPMPGMAPQTFGQQPQAPFKPPVQPAPVQNSFNETTVLSAVGGETTVLSEVMAPNVPYLTRVKSGEKVYINKPVFRIGKEKSYVDFFIADNTAISRSHCNIHSENGEYFIEDTNSTNHTYVNGRLINSSVKVKISNGDKIRLANEDFIFTI